MIRTFGEDRDISRQSAGTASRMEVRDLQPGEESAWDTNRDISSIFQDGAE